ncbi:TetR family transcriptional regulator [Haloferax prahovense DSM 18310]|uniref:TetR family transcriptional regulator n=1 Tax=Haloferax prahovense (strain DSM 18310 / JCM 13924 / TL6) TaxID=1227461 RepID=M0GAK6_HALPT|nr:TetR/AcrR family transcriptional regulator [Haloferax prahovense]ELZ69331.1 TetR family transcriptional regulator [Haloferax prahovense DSM 18310]
MTQDGRAEELEPAKRRIMEATDRALRKHGYGNLTIQHIADEFENSKTLLYYHYDGKDELLVDFLDYVLARFLDGLPQGDRTPREELETLVDALLPETLSEEAYRLQLSMFELRVNAPHDENCREEYRHVDAELTELLRDILVRGVEAGEFEVADPEAEAELFLSILTGTRARRLTVFEPDESIESLRAAIESHIDRISV